jgi:hypothetical protein
MAKKAFRIQIENGSFHRQFHELKWLSEISKFNDRTLLVSCQSSATHRLVSGVILEACTMGLTQ